MVFAQLKEMGMSCEFIAEQARLYIAELRYNGDYKPDSNLVLSDEDQMNIMYKQNHIEEMFSKVCDQSTIIVCDSSPFNSLLYMNEDCRNTMVTKKMIEKATFNVDLLFYCPPVEQQYAIDTNRVHSLQQSLEIDKQIEPILHSLAPAVWKSIIPLNGEPNARLSQVMAAISKRRFDDHSH